MSKGIGNSGRLVIALVMNQLRQNEHEWGCPYTLKQAAEDMSWAKLQGREVLEGFAKAYRLKSPKAGGSSTKTQFQLRTWIRIINQVLFLGA